MKSPTFGQYYVLVLANPTVLEIFYQVFVQKALVLANPTVLEMFYQGFDEKPNFW